MMFGARDNVEHLSWIACVMGGDNNLILFAGDSALLCKMIGTLQGTSIFVSSLFWPLNNWIFNNWVLRFRRFPSLQLHSTDIRWVLEWCDKWRWTDWTLLFRRLSWAAQQKIICKCLERFSFWRWFGLLLWCARLRCSSIEVWSITTSTSRA